MHVKLIYTVKFNPGSRMFSRSSLVAVHLAYKIKNVVSKCSGVPSSVLANTLHGVRSGNQFLQLAPSRDYRSAYRKVFWREICSHACG